jgi:hypothetical protein
MMPKSQTSGMREVSQKPPLLGVSLLEHIPPATNMSTVVKELFKAVFSIQSALNSGTLAAIFVHPEK